MTRRVVDETALRRALRALADEEARVETPAQIEAALMARFDEYRRTPRVLRRRTRTLVRGAATMAAGVILFGAVMVERELAPVFVDPPRRPAMPDTAPRTLPSTTATAGTAVAAQAPITSRPREPRSTVVLVGGPIASGELVQVVRMRVDRSALTALGIAQNGSAETVDIDVLVGEDGVARGLRLPL
jgi:AcrR family transcriptional regulator